MIEHGAATLPRPGSGRAADLLLLPDSGVYGLAVGAGTTGAWAAQRALGAVRERGQELGEIAAAVGCGTAQAPELLGLLQGAFDHAAWILHEEGNTLGVPTQAELFVVVVHDSSIWLGCSGQCVLVRSTGGGQALRSVPLGVLPRSRPELLQQSLAPRETFVLSSTALGSELADGEPAELARQLAVGLGSPVEQGVLVLRAGDRGQEADLLDEVASTRLLSALDRSTLERLRPYLLEQQVEPGSVVVREGDAGERLYLVLEGEVVVTRRGVELTRLGVGHHFGELAVQLGGTRTATITAASPARLVSLHRRHLRELSERRPEVATALLTVLLEDVAVRLRDLTELVTR